jgi:hypothetical protein
MMRCQLTCDDAICWFSGMQLSFVTTLQDDYKKIVACDDAMCWFSGPSLIAAPIVGVYTCVGMPTAHRGCCTVESGCKRSELPRVPFLQKEWICFTPTRTYKGQRCVRPWLTGFLIHSQMKNDLKYLVHCWPNVST